MEHGINASLEGLSRHRDIARSPTKQFARWPSIVDCIRHRAATQPERVGLYHLAKMTDVCNELTYRSLHVAACALASRLSAAGAKGERALLVMDNDPNYIIAFLACAYAGCVSVNVLAPKRRKHMERLALVVEDSGAKFVLTNADTMSKLSEDLPHFPGLRTLHWFLVDKRSCAFDAQVARFLPFEPDVNDVAYLQYTSGSTSEPRGVMVSHGNLMMQCHTLENLFGFTSEDRGLSWLPLYHDMGLIFGVLAPLYAGFPVGLTDPQSFVKYPDKWLRAISNLRISITGGPNFCYDWCVDEINHDTLSGVDLSCWSVALNGAEPVRASTIERFTRTFAHLGWQREAMHPAFGLAEYTLGMTAKIRGTRPIERHVDAEALEADIIQPRRDEQRSRHLVSSGRAVLDNIIRIVDPDTKTVCGIHTCGEIWAAGSNVTQGYWGRKDATAQAFSQRLPNDDKRYLRTGDLGFLDADGNLFITGRLKDLIVVHGRNHHPQDIEETVETASELIRSHFVAVFVVEEQDRERIVVAAEVNHPFETPEMQEGVAHAIFQSVARNHEIHVDEIIFLHKGQIPKTTSGKIRRSASREAFMQGTFESYGRVRRGAST